MDHSSHSYIDLSSSGSDIDDDDEEFSMADSSETDYDDDELHQPRRPQRKQYLRVGQGVSGAGGQVSERVSFRFSDDLNKCHQEENLAKKLLQREYMGNLRFCQKSKPLLSAVPNRLSFCFKDLVPANFLQGHMFMGLSCCGQFLLSYKVCSSENAPNASHYPFTIGYKYTLFFWIYQPHKPLRGFYKCCLFDDHGVDNVKEVSMIQWKSCDPRILIVHGASEEENEDSYITYIKVPKLGCLECRKQRDTEEEEGYFRRHILCIKCNLTVHTKYSTTESDRKFDPYLHLICPERILLISNGFFHMLHIRLEQPPKDQQGAIILQQQQHHQNMIAVLMLKPMCTGASTPTQLHDLSPQQERRHTPVIFTPNNDNDNFSVDSQTTNNSQSNVVSRIIEDFPDIETDSTHSGSGIAISTSHQLAAIGLKSPTSMMNNLDSPASQMSVGRKSCEELVFSSSPNVSSRVHAIASAVTNTPPTSSSPASGTGMKTNSPLFQNSPRRRHRIVTKSFRKGVSMFFSSTGITTTNTSSPNTSTTSTTGNTSSTNDRASTYEFCEENEKCEKISILRKRRLAERKYEFSEDNSENIIPFTKTRTSASNSFSSLINSSATGSHSPRHSHSHNRTHLHNSLSPYVSPSSSPHPHSSSVHYVAPSALSPLRHSCTSPLGFRSPPSTSGLITPGNSGCGSGGGVVGGGVGGVMRSPSRHLVTNNFYNNHKSPPHSLSQTLSPATQYMLSFKPHGTLSPLQLSITKRSHLERGGSISPNYQHPFLSPRRDEIRAFEVPLQGGAMSEKPVCTKKFQRRYVEEDDAASVITSEEDDCISPGYHTLLPVEVHGSCYSEMQMISKASFQQLRCTSVVIEQHSFDMETFTYYVISTLCQKNQKTYDFFYDWAYELINVCPLSQTIFCLLMAHFSAREEFASCLNCSRKLNCAFHRRQYECRVLFTWNMSTGEWDVLDFGELHDYKLQNIFIRKGLKRTPISLAQRAKKLAREMAQTLNKLPDYTSNLRVLDSNINKTKKTITDIDNMIEFYLKRPRAQ